VVADYNTTKTTLKTREHTGSSADECLAIEHVESILEVNFQEREVRVVFLFVQHRE